MGKLNADFFLKNKLAKTAELLLKQDINFKQ